MLKVQAPLLFKASGFSLIELMIAVLIIGIVFSFSFSSYQVWIQNTKIRTTAESIQNGLQIARSEAIKRNGFVQFNFRTRSAWTICIRPATPANCPFPDDATTIQSRLETEGGSDTITVAPTPASLTRITFNNYGQVDSAAVPKPFGSVNIDNSGLSSTDKRALRIVISPAGNTRMCDPKFSYTSDPKGC